MGCCSNNIGVSNCITSPSSSISWDHHCWAASWEHPDWNASGKIQIKIAFQTTPKCRLDRIYWINWFLCFLVSRFLRSNLGMPKSWTWPGSQKGALYLTWANDQVKLLLLLVFIRLSSQTQVQWAWTSNRRNSGRCFSNVCIVKTILNVLRLRIVLSGGLMFL